MRETLAGWGIGADSFVMSDGSGLSRYDYVTADTIVTILKHVWQDEKLRGPFLAALPVSAYDGTLRTRMRDTPLAGRVQAKTGTISNMRALVRVPDDELRRADRVLDHREPLHGADGADDAIAERMLLRLVTTVGSGFRGSGVPGSLVWFRGSRKHERRDTQAHRAKSRAVRPRGSRVGEIGRRAQSQRHCETYESRNTAIADAAGQESCDAPSRPPRDADA